MIELGTSNANTPAGSEETIGVGARVRLIHSDDPYTKLEPGDEEIVISITPLPESLGGFKKIWVKWDSGSMLTLIFEFVSRCYCDLREAISMEKRYFTSALESLS